MVGRGLFVLAVLAGPVAAQESLRSDPATLPAPQHARSLPINLATALQLGQARALDVQVAAERVNVAAARYVARRHPHWRYDEYEGIGHVPQMEIPEVVSERVLDWMDANRLSTAAS